VRCAATLEDYLSRPVGQYLAGPTYVIWWLSARLNGIMFWGRPEEDHLRRIAQALDAERAAGVRPHASIIDARYMESVGVGAFNILSEYIRVNRDVLSRVVKGQAVLRPGGLIGAVVAGFHVVLDPGYPTRVFANPAAALRWLEVEQDQSVLTELNDVRMKTIGELTLVSGLRAHLEQRPGLVTLKEAARALGLSPRDLQRKLREAQTRFQLEQRAAQVRVAMALLLETDRELKWIAGAVGCASTQHFSVLFRELAGEPPGQWRAHHRPYAKAPSAAPSLDLLPDRR
jgi:AraC-like DNA-binding protein